MRRPMAPPENDSALNNDSTCKKTDPNRTFDDQIPMCPNTVRDNSIWSVLRCSYNKAKTKKQVKAEDTQNLSSLFDAIQSHVNKSRNVANFAHSPITSNASTILAKADAVGLQACRSVDTTKNDSFLLFYTKPGVTVRLYQIFCEKQLPTGAPVKFGCGREARLGHREQRPAQDHGREQAAQCAD